MRKASTTINTSRGVYDKQEFIDLIHKKVKEGFTQTEIANYFGLFQPTISTLLKNKPSLESDTNNEARADSAMANMFEDLMNRTTTRAISVTTQSPVLEDDSEDSLQSPEYYDFSAKGADADFTWKEEYDEAINELFEADKRIKFLERRNKALEGLVASYVNEETDNDEY
ncbi:MAG TPA: hypothetical protein VF941_16320 [Clostridia bacterium]